MDITTLETINLINALHSIVFFFFFNKTENSTLPPIINALEAFKVVDILHAQTRDLGKIGSTPNGVKAPKLISLNLSSSGISGSVLAVIANLSNLETLDLSNNKLTGQISDFLGNLFSLKVLNIGGNKFTGPIPSQLLTKWRDGALSLSVDGLPNHEEVKKKKKVRSILPIAASISALFVILIILAVLWIVRRKQRESLKKQNNNVYLLETKNNQFNYSEIWHCLLWKDR
ncbi:hypothetical protein LIER_28158 [Lithospermum erythrorhizon]|uniref:Uncharacterized protein n=1 Tax=Lithospermum erythrorhizon TaxID=34254 RepID=A0AAV3RFS6_LITER